MGFQDFFSKDLALAEAQTGTGLQSFVHIRKYQKCKLPVCVNRGRFELSIPQYLGNTRILYVRYAFELGIALGPCQAASHVAPINHPPTDGRLWGIRRSSNCHKARERLIARCLFCSKKQMLHYLIQIYQLCFDVCGLLFPVNLL